VVILLLNESTSRSLDRGLAHARSDILLPADISPGVRESNRIRCRRSYRRANERGVKLVGATAH
jgi:hypothetical protein